MLSDADRDWPLTSLDSFNVARAAPAAFTGATANTRGNDGGTSDPLTLFTVTGDILVRIYGVVTTTLTGATATVSLGTTNSVANLIAATTATDLAANDVWADASPTEVDGIALSTVPGPFVIANGADIVEAVGTANVTAGNIYYICLWRPLSRGATVVAA